MTRRQDWQKRSEAVLATVVGFYLPLACEGGKPGLPNFLGLPFRAFIKGKEGKYNNIA